MFGGVFVSNYYKEQYRYGQFHSAHGKIIVIIPSVHIEKFISLQGIIPLTLIMLVHVFSV